MLILIVSGPDVEMPDLKASAVKHGHNFYHVTGFDNASVVLSEYKIDAIVVAAGLASQAHERFMHALALHPRYRGIPVSDLSGLSTSKQFGSGAL